MPDPKAQADAKLKMLEALYKAQQAEAETKRDVVVAEAKGESWLQRNWRPISMLTFLAVVINNYILAPWLGAFGLVIPVLDIAPQMWTLLTVGIGGYIVGRSGEKIAKNFNKKKFYEEIKADFGDMPEFQRKALEDAIEAAKKK